MAISSGNPAMDRSLHQAQDRFVEVWGQMAGAWGISRTMAQVHAILFISGEPLCSDDIMERLEISRGNASMSLRALVDWGIIERIHRRGDRKEYYKAEQDVWAMFRAIVRERTKREVDPLLASLYEIRDITGSPVVIKNAEAAAQVPDDARASVDTRASENAPTPKSDADLKKLLNSHHQRIDDLVAFFQTVEKVGGAFVSPAGRGLQLAASLLTRASDGRIKPPTTKIKTIEISDEFSTDTQVDGTPSNNTQANLDEIKRDEN